MVAIDVVRIDDDAKEECGFMNPIIDDVLHSVKGGMAETKTTTISPQLSPNYSKASLSLLENKSLQLSASSSKDNMQTLDSHRSAMSKKDSARSFFTNE